MTRPLVCLVMVGALFGGACTTTHQLTRPASIAELAAHTDAEAGGGGSVEIVYPAISPLGVARPGRLSPDFALERPLARYALDAVYVATPGQPTKLSLLDVHGYTVTRRGRGALEGAAIGTAVGVLAGVLLGATRGSDPTPAPMCTNLDGGTICTTGGGNGLTATEKVTIGGVALGLLGAGLGSLIGLASGHTDRFEF